MTLAITIIRLQGSGSTSSGAHGVRLADSISRSNRSSRELGRRLGVDGSSPFQVAGMPRSPLLNISSLPNSTSCQVCDRNREILMCLNDAIHPLAGYAKELCDFSDANEVVTHRRTI